MTDIPNVVVVDCLLETPPPEGFVSALEKDALDLVRNGELAKAQAVLNEAARLAQLPERETTRPMNADEVAQRAADQQTWDNGASDRLRAERDQKLTATDSTVLPDAPYDTAAWTSYRQQLRDLPAATSDPLNPVWPVPPATPAIALG